MVARFNGKRNHSKVKVLLALAIARSNKTAPLSLRQLSERSKVSLIYIRQRIHYWKHYGLVVLSSGLDCDQQPSWMVGISAGGRRYIKNNVPKDLLQQFLDDMN